jgi:hypothetical protein
MTSAEKLPEKKIFQARHRVFLDLALIPNIVIFIVLHILELPGLVTVAVAAAFTGTMGLLWMVLIRPQCRVEVTKDTITGHTPNFSKLTISLRKVDLRKTNRPSEGWKRKYFSKDIWTNDGKCIRLYRRLLGERQVAKIMTVVEKFPSRDTSVESVHDDDQQS